MLPHCDQMILGTTRALITKVPFGWLDVSCNVLMGCQKFSVCVPMHGMQAYKSYKWGAFYHVHVCPQVIIQNI